jgi:serine/threonine protein kinase
MIKSCVSLDSDVGGAIPCLGLSSLEEKANVIKVDLDVMRTKQYSVICSLDQVKFTQPLCTGRFGSIFCAHHKSKPTPIGAHVYHKTALRDSCQEHVPFREKRFLESMNHPCVVKVIGAISDHRNLYLFTDAPYQISLTTIITHDLKTNSISNDLKIYYMACVVSAIQYAHTKSLIFRGLHPDSLFVDNCGVLKLTDWGFAKNLASIDKTFTVCGHVEYLSPESIAGENGYDHLTDYWSLGVLIYEVLVGQSAFLPQTKVQHTLTNTPSSSSVGSTSHCANNTDMEYPHHHGTTADDDDEDANVQDHMILDNILHREPLYPAYLSRNAVHLIRKLLQKNPVDRLDSKSIYGPFDVRNHPWFSECTPPYKIDWVKMNSTSDASFAPPPCSLPAECKRMDGSRFSSQNLGSPPYDGYTCPEWRDFPTMGELPTIVKANRIDGIRIKEQGMNGANDVDRSSPVPPMGIHTRTQQQQHQQPFLQQGQQQHSRFPQQTYQQQEYHAHTSAAR